MIIKKLYIKIHVCIDSIIRKYQWKKDTKSIRNSLQEKELSTVNTDAKVLILAPHSDDEWIGCSQIIKHFPNSLICNMNMQGGDNYNTHNQRIMEMKKVADAYNRPVIHRNIDDSDSFSLIIQELNPDYICLPFFIDWHDEHREVMKMLKNVITSGKYSRAVLCYQVSVPIPPNYINYMIPMTKKEQNKKWKVFKRYYNSQSFMPIDRFKAHERINGALCNSYSAESFVIFNSTSWLASFMTKQISEKYKTLLKTSLNDIAYIHRIVCD